MKFITYACAIVIILAIVLITHYILGDNLFLDCDSNIFNNSATLDGDSFLFSQLCTQNQFQTDVYKKYCAMLHE